MRRALVAVAVASWAVAAQAGIVNDFNDILFWTGSGTNQAAFVLDFGTAAPQGSPSAVAWGYRWDGPANLADMMFALAGTISGSGAPAPSAGSDPRLSVTATLYQNFSGPGADDYFVEALAYDQVGLPPGWSQELRTLDNDFSISLSIASYVASTAGGVWPAGGSLRLAGSGPVGMALDDGGWYGYIVAQDSGYPDYLLPDPLTFSQPAAAIPEPAAVVLAACGIAGLGVRLRRRRWRATLGHAVEGPHAPGILA